MKEVSTLFLKLVLVLFFVITIVFCVFILPRGIMAEDAGMYREILIGMYIPAIPFLIAIYQAFKILDYIDKGKAFSQLPVDALRIIKICGYAISGLYALGLPYIFHVADKDDAPGVVLIALIIIFASFVIAMGASLYQRLLQNAIDIKSENDLTV